MSEHAVPKHWSKIRLGQLVSAIEAGKSFRCIEKPPTDRLPGVVKISAVTWGTFDEKESKTCPKEEQFDPTVQIRAGDFLMSRANTLELVGACVIVGSLTSRLMLSDKILRVAMPEELKRWALWFLRSKEGRTQIEARATGNQLSMRNIGQEGIRSIEIPITALDEQHRIVEAIESYFTRLDDAVATLERVQRNLKRYRASVLKAAVEGRLVPTEAELARAEGRSYEPASFFLERIARRPRREALPPAGLPVLPDGWSWCSVGELGVVSGGLTQNANRSRLPLQFPFLRVANVYANELRLDEIKLIGALESELDRVRLERGDLLVVEGNGSVGQIGRVALWDASIEPCLHQNHLIKIRFSPVELGKWSLLWLLSPAGRRAIELAASSTSGLHTLSIAKVAQLAIPLPPLEEQIRIAAEVDRLLTVSDAAVRETTSTLARCSRLRQSILKWAFEGRLVDQDPSDEPASVLLDRIKAERADNANSTKRKTTRRKGNSNNA